MKIKLTGTISHLAKTEKIRVEIEEPKRVGKVLRKKIPRYEELNDKIIFVNGKSVKEDYIVKDEDKVKVMDIIGGG